MAAACCAGARITARDYFSQVQDTELIYYVTHPDGRQERLVHAFPMRYLFRFEAEHLLARCGFEVEALYADYDKSPYGSKYPGELIFVARRPGLSRAVLDPDSCTPGCAFGCIRRARSCGILAVRSATTALEPRL